MSETKNDLPETKEDLKMKLRARLSVSKMQRLPRDNREEKMEKMKQQVVETLMKQ
jgi:hypothetical protein